jgi:hypothetical protein
MVTHPDTGDFSAHCEDLACELMSDYAGIHCERIGAV